MPTVMAIARARMTNSILGGRPMALVLVLFLAPEWGAAEKYTEWTGWKSTNDPLVQWRSRIQDWGKHMSPVCLLEFRIDGEGAANFRYDVIFQPEGPGSSTTGHRAGMAYGVKRDSDRGTEQILGCRQVMDARITRVVRRTGGTESATRQLPQPDEGPSSARPQPAEPTGRAGPQQVPDVIHFPGRPRPHRGAELETVRMDSRSLQGIRAESDRVGKRLLDWRPVRLWAQGRVALISQSDWTALETILSGIDKHLLRDLAADASRLANEYTAQSHLHKFWQAMADFYRYHGTA